jgi:hypothetical protein
MELKLITPMLTQMRSNERVRLFAMVLLLFVIYNLFCLTVRGARDEDGDKGENDDFEESEEEGFRFTVEKSKLLLDAYKKCQEKTMSGRQKKDDLDKGTDACI